MSPSARPRLAPLSLRRFLPFAAASLVAGALLHAGHDAHAETLTDHAGRRIELTAPAQRIYGSAPPFMVLLATLAPQRAIGLNFALPPAAARFGPPGLAQLPVLGGVSGHGQLANPETLLGMKPDLMLGWQFAMSNDQETEALARRVGAPLLMVRMDRLADWPAAYALVGQATGQTERARQLGDYIRNAMARVQAAVAQVPPEHRVRVYYAEQPDGLATECDNSFHAEAIALAGGVNVMRCTQKTLQGMERVDIEQVLAWDPQVIIAQDAGFAARVATDPRWAGVRAVRDGRVHLVPGLPFNWIDRPPSATRALGIQWLAGLFYPRRYPFDAAAEVPAFHRLFYGVDLAPADVQALMAGPAASGAAASMGHMHGAASATMPHASPQPAPMAPQSAAGTPHGRHGQ